MTGEKIGGLASDIFALVVLTILLIRAKKNPSLQDRKYLGMPYLNVLYAGIAIFTIILLTDLL